MPKESNPTLAAAEAEMKAWTCHDAGDGYVYYYNAELKRSQWERPTLWALFNPAGSYSLFPGESEAAAGVRRAREAAAAAERARLAAEAQDEVLAAAGPLSADDRRRRTEQVVAFRGMLRELGVSPYSTWDKTLPKMALDKRFSAVEAPELRRQIFDHFIRNHGKLGGAAAGGPAARAAGDDDSEAHRAFRAFLEGLGDRLAAAATLASLPTLVPADQRGRFKALLRELTLPERQRVLDAVMEPRRQAAQAQREERARALKRDFMALLRETPGVSPFSKWKGLRRKLERDPRARAVPPADAERYFAEFCNALRFRPAPAPAPAAPAPAPAPAPAAAPALQAEPDDPRERYAAAQEGFRALLRDFFGDDMPLDLRWEDVRPAVEHDERYRRCADCDVEHVFHARLEQAKQDAARALEALLRRTGAVTPSTPESGPGLEAALESVRRLPEYLRMACVPEERSRVIAAVRSGAGAAAPAAKRRRF